MYRILHTGMTPNYGGVEAVVMNWYRNIDREKIQFDFLASHDGAPIAYEQEIIDMGGHIYREYYGRKEKPFIAGKYIQKIFENDPSIMGVHMNLNTLEYITPLRLAKRHKLPVKIAHSHNAGNLNANDKLETRLMQMLNKKILQAPQYQKYGCSKEACKYMFGNAKSLVIHNAIQLEKYKYNEKNRKKLREQYKIDKDTVVIGFVGRIQYQKNPVFIIRVFKEFCEKNKNSKLVLIGTGPLENECKAIVQKLKLNDKVLFLGMKKETSSFYSMFDAFLFPSLFEGLGVVLVEAQANGLPCLVSDVIPDEVMLTPLVEKEKLSGSSQRWAEHLVRMLDEKKYDRKPDDYFEKIALAGYDITKEAKRLEDIYISLIEEK